MSIAHEVKLKSIENAISALQKDAAEKDRRIKALEDIIHSANHKQNKSSNGKR